MVSTTVEDFVGSPQSHLSNDAENAEKPLRATLLAELLARSLKWVDWMGTFKPCSASLFGLLLALPASTAYLT